MFEPKSEFLYSCKQFERNLNKLREEGQQGHIVFSMEAASSINSLTRVRALPNQRIDLATVDESARLTANAIRHLMSQVKDMNDKK